MSLTANHNMSPDGLPALQVRDSGAKGRGVFAGRTFRADEVIEVAPVIVIPDIQWPHIEPTELYHYSFSFGPDLQHAAIALGYGSLYNHSYTPNTHFHLMWEERTIRFVALRDIAEGEEILVNYNGWPSDQSPIWFEVEE
jgi:hypothetical protein